MSINSTSGSLASKLERLDELEKRVQPALAAIDANAGREEVSLEPPALGPYRGRWAVKAED
jgi:hypothetical protein